MILKKELITMNATLLLTNYFTELRKPKVNICPPSHLDGSSTEREEEKAKTTRELEFYSILDVGAP
jgi:hypothetical protein